MPLAAPQRAAGRLWCDSLTYDVTSLRLVVDRVGGDHVVVGTDYPFAAREVPAGAVLDGLDEAADADLRARIASRNADLLLAPVPHLEVR